MQQHELRQPKGATHKRKRVGRGNASGHGTYSTKGRKGQKARSGGGVSPHFEGGQLPFTRRMAYKRGFRNPFRVEYENVNVSDLARFDAGATVNAESLKARRLVQSNRPLKILGDGDLSVALTVEADSFSASAKSKIEAAGGSITWINGEPEARVAAEDKPGARKRAAKAEKVEKAAADAAAPKAERPTADEAAPKAKIEKQAGAGEKPAPKKRAPKAGAEQGPASAEAPAEEEAPDGAGS